jgi:FkbM family methyltransferase
VIRSGLLRKPDNTVCKRSGIFWDLDLQEGIDFSIWLLGGFELKTKRLYQGLIRKGDIIIDIGANIGAHTLPFAKLTGPHGKVYAFEPTSYAFNKLSRNLSLNPNLIRQVETVRMILMDNKSDKKPTSLLYSSWPLVNCEGVHIRHRGRLMDINGAEKSTLDDYVTRRMIERIDFIKIDVDGNEVDVLKGSWGTIQKFHPVILTEFAPYLFENNNTQMNEILSNLLAIGYEVRDSDTGRLLPGDLNSIERIIPKFGSINILLSPKVNRS